MMRRMVSKLLLLTLAACSGPKAAPLDIDRLSPMRKGELSRLFDQTGALDEHTALGAVYEVLFLPPSEQDYIDLLWGGRTGDALHAHRLGRAYLEAANGDQAGTLDPAECLERAMLWFRRAIGAIHDDTEAAREFAADVRYDLARAYVKSGDLQGAVELLANRTDPSPLSSDMSARYQELLASIAAMEGQ